MGVGLVNRLKRIMATAIWGARLTISGELIIVRDNFMPLEQEMIAELALAEPMEDLQRLCPQIKIEKTMGLADYTVKIFAVEGRIPLGDICEHLRDLLTDFAQRVYENQEFGLRMNVTGNIQDADQIREFRFLNKRDCVSYKIVSTEKREGRMCSLRRQLVNKLEESLT